MTGKQLREGQGETPGPANAPLQGVPPNHDYELLQCHFGRDAASFPLRLPSCPPEPEGPLLSLTATTSFKARFVENFVQVGGIFFSHTSGRRYRLHSRPEAALKLRSRSERQHAGPRSVSEVQHEPRRRLVRLPLRATPPATPDLPPIGRWRAARRPKAAVHQRRAQAVAAALRRAGGACSLRRRTRSRTRARAPVPQRPPTSEPSTTRRWGPSRSSSGYVASLRRVAVANAAPSVSAERPCGWPSRDTGETKVASQQSAPPQGVTSFVHLRQRQERNGQGKKEHVGQQAWVP